MFRLTADVKLNLCQNYLKKKISPSRKLIWHKDLRRHISCHFSPHATTSNQTRDATVKAARQGLILYEHQNKLIMNVSTATMNNKHPHQEWLSWSEYCLKNKTNEDEKNKVCFVVCQTRLWFRSLIASNKTSVALYDQMFRVCVPTCYVWFSLTNKTKNNK